VPATLRPFHPADTPGVYRVCLHTGDAGADAALLYRNPDLLGHVWAGAYPVADPGLCFVVADGEGVGGYVIGTDDTDEFEAWRERHWWPVLREQYPLVADPHDGTADHALVERIHRPPAADPPAEAPAHLHIDLLPRVQRQGWGRRLIAAFTDELRVRRVPGVYLDVDIRNTGGQAFYARLGFVVVDEDRHGKRLVLDLRG
jgi:ribosomal protein S18 acetylase RimI-like enzyme